MIVTRIKQYSRQHLSWESVLLISALAFFFLMPLRSDNSLFIASMGICALGLAKTQGLKLNAWTCDWFWTGMVGFAVYGASITISSMLHPETLRDWPRLLLWISCVISGIVCSKTTRHGSDKYAYALLAGIVCSIFAAIFMSLSDVERSVWQGDRLKLLSIHPSRLALYTSTAFFFSTYKAFTADKNFQKIVFFAIALTSLALTIATNTRTLILFIPIAACFYIFLIPQKRTALIFILSILTFFFGFIWATKEQQSTERLLSGVFNITQDRTFITRIPIWHAGWDAFTTAPLLGNGMHSYKRLHAAYIDINKTWLNEKYPTHEISVKQAHNVILGRMVESGVVGTIGFLTFYICAIVCAAKSPHGDRWIFILLIFYMLIGTFDDPLFRKNDTFILFLAGYAFGHNFRSPSISQVKNSTTHDHS